MNLAGRRVLLTRAVEDCEAWAQQLRARGAEPVVHACVKVEPLPPPRLRAVLAELGDCRWWWFTSRRGVETVAGLAVPWPEVRLAAVGAATAAALEAAGARADLVGSGNGAEALAREWLERTAAPDRGTVGILAADRAGRDADAVLQAAGVPTRRRAVYRTCPRGPNGERARLDVDLVLLASPSAVEGLQASAALPEDVPVLSIGPRTSRAVREAGWRLAGEAAHPTLEAMLESLE